jgi:hypothetical protein
MQPTRVDYLARLSERLELDSDEAKSILGQVDAELRLSVLANDWAIRVGEK